MDISVLAQQLIARECDLHKGQCGRIGLFAGSQVMLGAAILAGTAALRSGAGLVYAYCQDLAMVMPMVGCCPSLIGVAIDDWLRSKDYQLWFKHISSQSIDVLAIGPGLAASEDVVLGLKAVVDWAYNQSLPMVLDADVFTHLSVECVANCSKNTIVLTPHEGEFKRFFVDLGATLTLDLNVRQSIAQKAARQSNQVIVLKGHQTVVATADHVYVNTTGNSAMATAGMGDVLTGIIAAFIGQGLTAYEAACLGVYCHGLAADRLQKTMSIGLIASDICQELPMVLASFSK